MIYMSESDFLMLILLLFFSSWVIGVDVTVVVIIHSGSAGGVWHCAKQQQQRWQTHTEWRQETFEFRSNPETDTMRIKKNDYGYKVWNVSESERERKKKQKFCFNKKWQYNIFKLRKITFLLFPHAVKKCLHKITAKWMNVCLYTILCMVRLWFTSHQDMMMWRRRKKKRKRKKTNSFVRNRLHSL